MGYYDLPPIILLGLLESKRCRLGTSDLRQVEREKIVDVRISDHPEQSPLHEQIAYLDQGLRQNPLAQAVLRVASEMDLPGWYFGAGGVAESIWNVRHAFPVQKGIKDYDVVYFDPTDLSAEGERRLEREMRRRIGDPSVALDVKNEARAHLWYEERFGRHLDPYISSEAAIATWPTTASSVGVRQGSGGFVVCAPFGLSDLLGMIARPNKAVVTQEAYEEKVSRWAQRWPRLQVIPW